MLEREKEEVGFWGRRVMRSRLPTSQTHHLLEVHPLSWTLNDFDFHPGSQKKMLNFTSPPPYIVLFFPRIHSVASPSMTFLLHIYSQVCIIRFFFSIIPIVFFLPVSQEWRTMGITAQEGSDQPGVGAVRGSQTPGQSLCWRDPLPHCQPHPWEGAH